MVSLTNCTEHEQTLLQKSDAPQKGPRFSMLDVAFNVAKKMQNPFNHGKGKKRESDYRTSALCSISVPEKPQRFTRRCTVENSVSGGQQSENNQLVVQATPSASTTGSYALATSICLNSVNAFELDSFPSHLGAETLQKSKGRVSEQNKESEAELSDSKALQTLKQWPEERTTPKSQEAVLQFSPEKTQSPTASPKEVPKRPSHSLLPPKVAGTPKNRAARSRGSRCSARAHKEEAMEMQINPEVTPEATGLDQQPRRPSKKGKKLSSQSLYSAVSISTLSESVPMKTRTSLLSIEESTVVEPPPRVRSRTRVKVRKKLPAVPQDDYKAAALQHATAVAAQELGEFLDASASNANKLEEQYGGSPTKLEAPVGRKSTMDMDIICPCDSDDSMEGTICVSTAVNGSGGDRAFSSERASWLSPGSNAKALSLPRWEPMQSPSSLVTSPSREPSLEVELERKVSLGSLLSESSAGDELEKSMPATPACLSFWSSPETSDIEESKMEAEEEEEACEQKKLDEDETCKPEKSDETRDPEESDETRKPEKSDEGIVPLDQRQSEKRQSFSWMTSSLISRISSSSRRSSNSPMMGRHINWRRSRVNSVCESNLLQQALARVADKDKAMNPERAHSGLSLLNRMKNLLERQDFDDTAGIKTIENVFFDSMPRKHLEIRSIEQVLRVDLLKRFLRKVADDFASIEATFHGTREEYIKDILDVGLNPSLCATGAYGRGAYVGTHAGVAHQYADPNEEGWRHMLVMLVIVGSSVVKGKEGEQCPSTALDSLVNPTQYCFVEEDRLYCSHLITYRVLKSSNRRTGGGWEDPFQRKLACAVSKAAKLKNKSGIR